VNVSARGKVLKPPMLKKGDRVGLVCPASRPYERSVLVKAIACVEEMGFVPEVGKNVLNINGYLAGTDQERLQDLHQFFADPKIAGIFCVTGGYGSLRLLDSLDYDLISRNPKIFVGADEITSLMLGIFSKTNLVSCYGPNLDQISSAEALKAFQQAMTSPCKDWQLSASSVGWTTRETWLTAGAGKVTGTVIGANLNALISLMGTPYMPDLSDAILCLDDIEERNDSLDRWFTNLDVSGILKKVKGLAFGHFSGFGPRGSRSVLSWEDLFYERLTDSKKVACFGLPFGDSPNVLPLPLGISGVLSVEQGTLSFTESLFDI
jgi:muramoyltetrapeptide carboxypeptidase